MKAALVLCAMAALGCGKKKTAETCGALTVSVDGKPRPAMPHGLARANIASGDKNYEVEVFNHDKTTCEQMISKSGRQVPDGEVSVRAFAGGDGLMGKGVGIDMHTQAGGDIYVVGDKPKAVGDTLSICVEGVTFTPRMGEHKDKKIEIKGLFTGKYCGELTF